MSYRIKGNYGNHISTPVTFENFHFCASSLVNQNLMKSFCCLVLHASERASEQASEPKNQKSWKSITLLLWKDTDWLTEWLLTNRLWWDGKTDIPGHVLSNPHKQDIKEFKIPFLQEKVKMMLFGSSQTVQNRMMTTTWLAIIVYIY